MRTRSGLGHRPWSPAARAVGRNGRRVDQTSVFYARSRLHGEAPDGTPIAVEVGSGLTGQLTRRVLLADGKELPLEPVGKG